MTINFQGSNAWMRPFLATMALGGLVALGVADDGVWFPIVVLGTAALGFGVLFRVFPRGLDFALGSAIGFATYAALFAVIARTAFPEAPDTLMGLAFFLPMGSFLLAVLSHQATLRRLVDQGATPDEWHLRRIGRFSLILVVIAAGSLSLPANRMGPAWQGVVMVAGAGLIGAMAAAAVREVVRLMVDMAQLMDAMSGRVVALVVPIAAYTALFSLITIVFACLYRIADGLSRAALFFGPAGAIRLTFRDALHFSIVTISTVGYGDIWPVDDGARLLAAVEVLAGQVLLLFGFYEITRSRLSAEEAQGGDGPPAKPGPGRE
ncbi:two pore domain potassium channel family protein [Roseomonas nepalensis]|uniref:Two pore domain potassium channel family protein n=1 Tax=Muricoccus nepalensis TaxID=1854500 RepID=A0A502G247_9PROT|nr:potassium channel family protein [Roseomonas nepalensis]TPG55642.1 two pore domain potassium channel family protein [Roseomonas nepalensis]